MNSRPQSLIIAFVQAVDAQLWNSAGDRLGPFFCFELLLSSELLRSLLYSLYTTHHSQRSCKGGEWPLSEHTEGQAHTAGF